MGDVRTITKYLEQNREELTKNGYRVLPNLEFKEFTNALDHYLNMGKYKYAKYTDKIYQIVFLENAKEYKKIRDLKEKDRLRDTLYL